MIAYFIGGSRDLSKQKIERAERWLQFYRPSRYGDSKLEIEHYIYVTQIHNALDAGLRPDRDEKVHVYALSHITSKELEGE